jgi:hypothetical protein
VRQLTLVFLLLFNSLVQPLFAHSLPATAFFTTLKLSSTPWVANRINTHWQPDIKHLYQAFRQNHYHKSVNPPSLIRSQASGVADTVWQFKQQSLNQHFSNLFTLISTMQNSWGFHIDLSANDLFHGHVFAILNNKQQHVDLGILFHCKEYPRDLAPLNQGRGANSPFTTQSPGYNQRNFIWLASTGEIYDLTAAASDIYPQYFLPANWHVPIDDPNLGDITRNLLKAKTFLLENLSSVIQPLGDVNFFSSANIPWLFFTYTASTSNDI